MKAEKYYSDRIVDLNLELKQVQKKYHFVTFLRLLFFTLACSTFFFFWGNFLLIPFFIASFAFFLFAVNLSVDAKYKRDKVVVLIEINQNEIKVLNGDWSMFEDGSEFRDGQHPFSLDMDIFGKKSVFQLLNRTSTLQGKKKFADTLANGTKRIKENNACILELSKNMNWCQEFIAEGLVRKNEKDIQTSLKSLSHISFEFGKVLNFLRFSLPIIAISSSILMGFGLISAPLFGVILTIVLLPISRKLKDTNGVSHLLSLQSNRVKVILKQLELFHALKIETPLFKKEQDELLNSESSVLHSVQELNKIMGRFDFRLNFIIGIVFNFFLAWDFQVLFQIKSWLDKNRGELEKWEDKMAELEVWISGAFYYHNHPKAIFAEFQGENDEIEILELSHPFIDQNKSVSNDVSLKSTENFTIITGPNMAGKSTYLRGLGLTFVFSNAGFPVLAKSCKIPNLKLFSSMRTSDDLTVESSYFHAELVRLRFIMDAIERGEKIFIILDEILKGTNSKDKEIGSARFLQKLKRLNSKGIIATHDLSLCDLATNDSTFKNMCFDSVIEGDNLSFNYKINEGICKNMNASFLLTQMKLVDEI